MGVAELGEGLRSCNIIVVLVDQIVKMMISHISKEARCIPLYDVCMYVCTYVLDCINSPRIEISTRKTKPTGCLVSNTISQL